MTAFHQEVDDSRSQRVLAVGSSQKINNHLRRGFLERALFFISGQKE